MDSRQPFDAEIVHLDGAVVVALVGELDISGTQLLRDLTGSLASRYDASQVTFDCSGLTFIDAHGIGVLISINRRFGAGTLTLRNVQDRVRNVLDRTGTTGMFDVADEDVSA